MFGPQEPSEQKVQEAISKITANLPPVEGAIDSFAVFVALLKVAVSVAVDHLKGNPEIALKAMDVSHNLMMVEAMIQLRKHEYKHSENISESIN